MAYGAPPSAVTYNIIRFVNTTGTGEELYDLVPAELKSDVVEYGNLSVEVVPSLDASFEDYVGRMFPGMEIKRKCKCPNVIIVFLTMNKDKDFVKRNNHNQMQNMFKV